MTIGRPRKYDDLEQEVLRLLGLGWAVRRVAMELGMSKSAVGRVKTTKGVRG